jgi:arsenical pump membrane protein
MIPLILLIGVLAFAVARPFRLPEAVGAVPAAGIVLAAGLVSWRAGLAELGALGPTVGFLAAILVLAHLADAEGVFRYAGTLTARRSGGSPRRLLGVVFAIAALVTAVLSLDATVVLLTPVVLATAARVGARPRPPGPARLARRTAGPGNAAPATGAPSRPAAAPTRPPIALTLVYPVPPTEGQRDWIDQRR